MYYVLYKTFKLLNWSSIKVYRFLNEKVKPNMFELYIMTQILGRIIYDQLAEITMKGVNKVKKSYVQVEN